MSPQVFVSGTWRDDKARAYRDQAEFAGSRLADAGFDLACGPGTGIARYVIDGYRSRPARGIVRYYLPAQRYMAAVGEEVLTGSDEIEETEFDYPMRNVYQISKSDGVLVLTGGDGALEEALPALIDYGLPVAVVEGAGSAAVALKRLVEVYPEWGPKLIFGAHVSEVLDDFCSRVAARAAEAEQ